MTKRTDLSGPARWGAGLLAALGWAGLVLQFLLLLGSAGKFGLTQAGAVLRFFSYFTIDTNLLVALVATAVAAGAGGLLMRPGVHAAAAIYIVIVGAVYALVLRGLWAPQGPQWLADAILHYAVPVLYGLFWLLVLPKHGLRWRDPLLWLIYPTIYCAIVLLLGGFSGFYPYPFIDVVVLGPVRTGFNILGLLAVFVAAGLVAVGLGRWKTQI